MDYPLELPDQLAQHLRALRKTRGLSQAALASKLGLTQSRIAAIERNPAALGAGQLLRVLSALDAQLVLRDTRATKTVYPETTQSTSFPAGEW
jgi:HTH-type transcriptional regulator / antitoxin HipB